jgi:hypothetical protein
MVGYFPPPAHHNSSPAPTTLPEDLMLACFVLLRRDAVQLLLVPTLRQPIQRFEVVNTHYFLLQAGDSTGKVSSHSLKPAPTQG